MKPDDDWTLAQARDWLREHVDDGEACPCCTQFAKVYKRTLTRSIAKVLGVMYHRHRVGFEWVYLPEIRSKGQDEAIARYWGLIEARPGERDDGCRRVGWWRLTPHGVAFIEGKVQVPKHMRVYAQRSLGPWRDTKMVSFTDALGEPFNYSELMSA